LELQEQHLTPEEFQQRFDKSKYGIAILEKLQAPDIKKREEDLRKMASVRFANSSYRSLELLTSRELLLWWRDKYFIKTKILQSEYRLCGNKVNPWNEN
jgi:hypothetical protein